MGGRLIWQIDWRLKGRARPEGLEKKDTLFIAVIKRRCCSAMLEFSFCPHLLHRQNILDINLLPFMKDIERTVWFLCTLMQHKVAMSAHLYVIATFTTTLSIITKLHSAEHKAEA